MDILTFMIDQNSPIPIYEQLYEYIKSEIESERIPFNSKLPSKRKLSVYLKISQNTIQTAYDQLIEEGYISSLERKGFFVCKLDNILKLDMDHAPNKMSSNSSDQKIKFDFSYNGVDMQSFPFSIWRKLSKELINEYDKDLMQLGDSQGNLHLRNNISNYLHQSRGFHCSPDQIIISAGTEYLFQLLIKLFDDSKIYGIENPGYEKLNLLFKSSRAEFNSIDIDQGGMILNKILQTSVSVLCITPAHQFPLGGIMPINRRIQLLNWAYENKNRYIIEDDYDSEFKYSGKPVPALKSLDKNDKVIYMGTFSKSLSPALRVSYMVLPENLVEQYKKKLPFIICPVPTIEQKILNKFIENGYFQKHLNRMRTLYKKKREILVSNLLKLKIDTKIKGADAGLHIIINVNNGMTETELISSALSNGVKVYGLSKYYISASPSQITPSILLGYATMTETEIKDALKLLEKAWS